MITRDTLEEWERAYHELKAAEPGSLPDRTTTVAEWVARWEAKGNPASGWPRSTTSGRC